MAVPTGQVNRRGRMCDSQVALTTAVRSVEVEGLYKMGILRRDQEAELRRICDQVRTE